MPNLKNFKTSETELNRFDQSKMHISSSICQIELLKCLVLESYDFRIGLGEYKGVEYKLNQMNLDQ